MTKPLTTPGSPEAADHPVNQYPGHLKALILGFQHVLAAYAGAVAVPLFVGWALVDAGRMSPSDIPHLIAADLFVAGIATIVQSLGLWRFGVRLPLIQGCTFSAAIPMVTIGGTYGVPAIYGAVIASGVFMMVFAPLFASLLRLFPPLVTGTVLLIIGTTLMPVAADWVGGGADVKGTDAYGTPQNLAIAFFVLAFILVIDRWGPPMLSRIAVLLGLIVGLLVCIPLGMVDWSGTAESPALGLTTPFYFGLPEFVPAAVLAMCIVSLVTMVEATGDVLAIGEITDTKVDDRRIADTLRADGAATVLGGIFNTFQYTAFAQNIGVLSLTGVRSRWVTAVAGGFLIILGLLPKTAAIVAAIPAPVLGGAGIALFGMVAAAGVRTLSGVKFTESNIVVVAVPLALGLLPAVAPSLFSSLPAWSQTFLSSGIVIGSVAAILLNLMFNTGARAPKSAPETAHDTFRGKLNLADADHDGFGGVAGRRVSG
ncbi:nucleobase:cation symporter-2 family protein [Corynebacterium sp.]|uniref:nucleobase:cation symporter-2 family protein n=1 Tax=Corynebacterium sp. TaxID=1720 RepID=UPI0026DB37FB|nr:nucleobase:cation symporter-2 family protein [Corynebacterium sp.]MDO4609452.1 nucleobase:cation symporter-2 family protein [Corynebacterium sp.]